jgi:formylglycine-generating enzyme required for sulfatase activity
MEFSCKLSQLTGRKYRMTTEAEWEYAAKNKLSSLEKVGTGEEWAYNSRPKCPCVHAPSLAIRPEQAHTVFISRGR